VVTKHEAGIVIVLTAIERLPHRFDVRDCLACGISIRPS